MGYCPVRSISVSRLSIVAMVTLAISTVMRNVSTQASTIIEEKTAGAVKCEQLRPDVRWGVLREAA